MVGDLADAPRLEALLASRGFAAVVHCAAHIWVGESVRDPIKYYANNTGQRGPAVRPLRPARHPQRRLLVDRGGLRPARCRPDRREPAHGADQPLRRLEDDGRARAGRSRRRRRACATRSCATSTSPARTRRRGSARRRLTTRTWSRSRARRAMGLRPGMRVNGTDYPTPDGTCIRDYVHVDDLARAHSAGAASICSTAALRCVANCGYGHGFSVREVLDTARRVTGVAFPIEEGPRRPGDPAGAGRRQPPHPGAARLGAAPRRPRVHRRHRLALGAAAAGDARGSRAAS